jgi:error-prone DNA polymerase
MAPWAKNKGVGGALAGKGFWQQFRSGALARVVDEKTARAVFEKLLGFAEYGFPKSHAAAFAVLAYQSAWLKRYYPAEFHCALFNAQPMGFYTPHVFTNDAKRHGMGVISPDINSERRRVHGGGRARRVGRRRPYRPRLRAAYRREGGASDRGGSTAQRAK